MNKTIQFVFMAAAVAAVGLAATVIMSPSSAHADQPRYCFSNGDGGLQCFPSKHQCEEAANHDQQCSRNRS